MEGSFKEVLDRLGVDILLAAQDGLNNLVEEAAEVARQDIDSGIEAQGPKSGDISTDTGAMREGYYTITFGNGEVNSGYLEAFARAHEAKESAFAGEGETPDMFDNGGQTFEAAPMPQIGSYSIGRNTRTLHAMLSNVVDYTFDWEEGHFNALIGGYARAHVGLNASEHAKTHAEAVIGSEIEKQLSLKQK